MSEIQKIGSFVPFATFQQRDVVVESVFQFRETFQCFQVFRYKDKNTEKRPLDQATDRAKELCTKAGLDGYTLPVFALDNEPYLDEEKNEIKRGQKRFIVASYQSFWQHLVKTAKLERNYYETILVDTPCHLHIDAEYNYATNSKAERSDWFEERMREVVNQQFVDLGYVSDVQQDLEWIILEASNQKKFSRHYIVKMKQQAFRNNFHCGAFMRRVEKTILERFGKDMGTNPFYLWRENEKDFIYHADKMNKVCFFDMTIYNVRRQFRTVGSVKVGEKDYENRALRQLGTILDWKQPEMVLGAMIQRVSSKTKIVSCMEWTGEEPTSRGNSRQDQALRMGLTPKEAFSMLAPSLSLSSLFLVQESFSAVFQKDPDSVTTPEKSAIKFSQVREAIEQDIGNQYDYAMPLSNRGYNAKTRLICLDSRSKNCLIAGREHSNNRIYFVASLDRLHFYQKCFHCAGSSSHPVPFSSKTRTIVQQYLKEHENHLMQPQLAKKLVDYVNIYELLES